MPPFLKSSKSLIMEGSVSGLPADTSASPVRVEMTAQKQPKLTRNQLQAMHNIANDLPRIMRDFPVGTGRTYDPRTMKSLENRGYLHHQRFSRGFYGYTLTPDGLQWIADNCAPAGGGK